MSWDGKLKVGKPVCQSTKLVRQMGSAGADLEPNSAMEADFPQRRRLRRGGGGSLRATNRRRCVERVAEGKVGGRSANDI